MDKNKVKEVKNNAGKNYIPGSMMDGEFATELNESKFKKEYNANLKNNTLNNKENKKNK